MREGGGGELTNAAGFLRGPLVVFLAGDVFLAHQLEGGQTLEVESVSVTKTCPLTFAVCRDSGISTATLFNLCVGRINKKTHTQVKTVKIQISQYVNLIFVIFVIICKN